MTNWEEELKEAFKKTGDDYKAMKTTLTKEELHKQFDDGYGPTEGAPFTAWGKKYVYFPLVYDGEESVGYARRDVCKEKAEHQCGG